MIDWDSNITDILLNPRHTSENIKRWTEQLNILPSHIWIQTSGSSGTPKFVALSKEAVLTSAREVNTYLESDHNDTWVNVLPKFHVGGLGILARSYLSGAKLINLDKWNPEEFALQKGTLSALVPAQLFDLVQKKLIAPKSLRSVVIGGGALDSYLAQEAKKLGWPIVPSYGLSECASQVATGNRLTPLSHIKLKIEDGLICIKSPSLLTGYCYIGDKVKFVDPKVDGWFKTEDCGTFDGEELLVTGRCADQIKIGGESVNLQGLQSILEQVKLEIGFKDEAALFTAKDQRLGFVIHLVVTGSEDQKLIEKFNQKVLPFEKIRKRYKVQKIFWKSCLKPIIDVKKTKRG